MGDALTALVGKEAQGLSSSTVSRLKKEWGEQYHAWRKHNLSKDKWYISGLMASTVAYDQKIQSFVRWSLSVLMREEKNTSWLKVSWYE